ncbi:hypothetical protein K1719_038631 [Acacia pycnantha]|nr:hypothetical protein K1719_038631 [Acacia pycnantha]
MCSCPFCRKVREMVVVLDIDVLYYPCPRNGPNFRLKVAQMGGKQLFPYMWHSLSLLLQGYPNLLGFNQLFTGFEQRRCSSCVAFREDDKDYGDIIFISHCDVS